MLSELGMPNVSGASSISGVSGELVYILGVKKCIRGVNCSRSMKCQVSKIYQCFQVYQGYQENHVAVFV